MLQFYLQSNIHYIKDAFNYWQYRWTSHRGKSGNFNWIYDLLLKMSKLLYALSWIASSAIEDLKESMRDTLTTDKPRWHMVLSFLQHVMELLIYLGNYTSSVAQIYSDLVWVLRGSLVEFCKDTSCGMTPQSMTPRSGDTRGTVIYAVISHEGICHTGAPGWLGWRGH